MRRRLFIALILGGLAAAPALAESDNRPPAVSFDYCADLHLLALAGREQILALSRYQGSDFSYFPAPAPPYPKVRGTAEEALALGAGLVLRAFGGGANLSGALAPYGIPVFELAYGADFEVARENLRRTGRALGREEKARALIGEMDARLARIRDQWKETPKKDRPWAIYLTPSGATTGSGTLVHSAITAAGFRNLYAEAGREGWFMLDLERLVLAPPDAIVAGFFDIKSAATDHWNLARHHLLRRLLDELPSVRVPGKLLDCTAWTAVEAVEKIHSLYARLQASGQAP